MCIQGPGALIGAARIPPQSKPWVLAALGTLSAKCLFGQRPQKSVAIAGGKIKSIQQPKEVGNDIMSV